MKILHVVPSFFPATKWGGPIFSTKEICDGIAALRGVELRVLTTDAAGPARHDRVTPADLGYPVHHARRVAGHSIAPGLLARLPSAIAWADIVHLTGTYSFPTLPTLALAKLMQRPVVWSPRGALQATAEWAGAPNHFAKTLLERVANHLRPAGTVLHVTADVEAQQSVNRLPNIATVTIPNAVEIPPSVDGKSRRQDRLRLIYLGRLHPKKGVDLLLDALAALPASTTLDIYGTGEQAYVRQLRAQASMLKSRVTFHGHVTGTAKSAAFANADLFVLPTLSENFGIAVAEALAHGVPVLTTTAAPWRGLDLQGCGRCIDLTKSDLAREITRLSAYDLAAMGARGRAWMARDFSPEAMNAAFAALYHSMSEGAPSAVTA